ncbi:glycosyltransferase family 4 protein [Marinilabiliaceae bacterium ANBcel2]|nr:glycosyltransferase family 4 protein [Marinilabiliaceae bacterium ANBcel2]
MNKKSKRAVIVFVDWYLPGYKSGGPVRSVANMIDHLFDDFDFYIVTRNCEYGENSPYPNIISDTWNDFGNGVKVWYSSKGTPSLTLWRRLIKESAVKAVYINGIYSPLFSMLPLIAAHSLNIKNVIVAPRGMLAKSAINIKRFKKKLFIFFMKFFGLYRNVNWHATNCREADDVSDVLGLNDKNIVVAPNFARKAKVSSKAVIKDKKSLRVCSLARIAPEKNTLFSIESLNYVSPDVLVEFHLYGHIYDKKYWSLCVDKIEALPQNIKVTYKGFVEPDKIEETIQDYHLLFLPSRGENFGHVIVESFIASRPVLISDQTPWKDLSVKKAGFDLPLNSYNDFARVIEKFAYMDHFEYEEWKQGAKKEGLIISEDSELKMLYINMFLRR